MKSMTPAAAFFLSLWLAALSAFSANAQTGTAPKILVIGDSHTVGSFGKTLDAQLRKIPKARVETYGSCSAYPSWFFTGTPTPCGAFAHTENGQSILGGKGTATPLLPKLMENFHPDFTVIALGTNQLKGSEKEAESQIRRMISEVHSRKSRCIWVGPPDEEFVSRATQENFYTLLQALTGELDCQLIDSRKYTHYPATGGDITGDRIHYDSLRKCVKGHGPRNCERWQWIGPPLGAEWGKQVAGVVEQAVIAIVPEGLMSSETPAAGGAL